MWESLLSLLRRSILASSSSLLYLVEEVSRRDERLRIANAPGRDIICNEIWVCMCHSLYVLKIIKSKVVIEIDLGMLQRTCKNFAAGRVYVQ